MILRLSESGPLEIYYREDSADTWRKLGKGSEIQFHCTSSKDWSPAFQAEVRTHFGELTGAVFDQLYKLSVLGALARLMHEE